MKTGIGTSNLRSLGRRSSIKEIERLLDAALGAGSLTIDTADIYGAGSVERALAAAIGRSESLTRDHERFRIVTKGGYRFADLPLPLRPLNQPVKRASRLRRALAQDFSSDALEGSVRASQQRLDGLRIYAYCLHNPPAETLAQGDAVAVLARLRHQGAFHRVGVSVDSAETADLLAGLDGVDLVELPAEVYIGLSLSARQTFATTGVEVLVNRVSAVAKDLESGLVRLTALVPGPDVAVVGTRNPAHVYANAIASR